MSPIRTSRAALAGCPLDWILPSTQARAAHARVLKNLAAHSHLSILMLAIALLYLALFYRDLFAIGGGIVSLLPEPSQPEQRVRIFVFKHQSRDHLT